MNKDNAKDYLPLVQALAEGKTIQCEFIPGIWEDNPCPGWSMEARHYRVKPEPMTVWINMYNNGYVYVHFSEERALEGKGHSAIGVTKKFVEVIE